MTLSIFIYSLSGGGAERVVSYLLPYLQKRGHSVHLVLMNSTISYTLPKDISIHYLENSKPNEHGVFKLLKLPYLAYKYAKLTKKLKLTHSFSLLSRPNYVNIMMRFFNKNPPKVIISERNYPSMQYGYGDLQSKINKYLIKKLYYKADLTIGNSKANVEDLINNYNVCKKLTKVIQNPIDIDVIDKIPPVSDFFDADYFNIITVGRLEAVKNHELLIKAMPLKGLSRLYILGKGHLLAPLKKLVADRNFTDRVFFLGFDNNPYKYMKEADLFIFGSNHEGFPNVILEAMCCGLPILTTNCKSGPDEILQLKSPMNDDIMITPYGVLSPVTNTKLMRKGLDYFLNNPAYLRSCSKNALTRVRDFEKEKVLENYEMALTK